MTFWLKQSTAASIPVGPFLDETDGVTSKESFTSLSGIIYKNNAASVTINPAVVHTASGYYTAELDSGSTGTLGQLRFAFANSSSHLPVWEDFTVVTGSTYDALVSGTDRLAAELGASGIAASNFAASALDAEAVDGDGANKIADYVLRREWGDAASSNDGDTKAGRSLLGAAAKLVNKIELSSGCLVIYEADDVTVLFRQPVTASDAASPIVALDTT